MKLGNVTEHRPPLKRVDLGHIGRPQTITVEDVQNGKYKEPCAEAYRWDVDWHIWVLKD